MHRIGIKAKSGGAFIGVILSHDSIHHQQQAPNPNHVDFELEKVCSKVADFFLLVFSYATQGELTGISRQRGDQVKPGLPKFQLPTHQKFLPSRSGRAKIKGK